MAFIYKKSRNANAGREIMAFTIADSQATTSALFVGAPVKLASGKLTLWGLGGAGLGIVVGFQKADGSPVTDNGAGGAFSGTYTTGASNTVQALVDISTESVYSVPQDATLGTTTGSGLAGYNTDVLATGFSLDESSTVSTTASFVILGVDPDGSAPANSVLVSIQESQIKL